MAKLLGGTTINGTLSAQTVVYDGSGNSLLWNTTYSAVQSNSASNWSYQGTDIKALTGNWESTYTTFTTNSATYGSGGITIGQVMALQSINIY